MYIIWSPSAKITQHLKRIDVVQRESERERERDRERLMQVDKEQAPKLFFLQLNYTL